MANTITITATKANTIKTIEYLHPVTGIWQDSNILINVAAGIYNLHRARLKNSMPEISFTSNLSVTVVNALNSIIVPVNTYNLNTFTIPSSSTHPAFSEFSYSAIEHNGTQARLGIWSNLPNNITGSQNSQFAPNNDTNTSPVGIGIIDNEEVVINNGSKVFAPIGVQANTVGGSISYVLVDLPKTGLRTTKFYNSYVQNYSSLGIFWGACIVSIEILGSNLSAAEIIIPDNDVVVVIEGDSTTGGIQSTAPFVTSYVGHLRNLQPTWSFKNMGAGGAKISNRYDTQAKRLQAINTIMQAWGDAVTCILLYGTSGINDYASSSALGSTMGQYLNLFFNELKDAMIAANKSAPQIILITPGITTIEDQGSRLESGLSMRTGMSTAIIGNECYTSLIDGTTLYTVSQLYDGVHQNDSGYESTATVINNKLNILRYGYAAGYNPVNFSSVTNLVTQDNGLIKATGQNMNYGYTGLGNLKMPANVDSRIITQRRGITDLGLPDAGNVVVFLSLDKAEKQYTQGEFGFFFSPSDNVTFNVEAGDLYRLKATNDLASLFYNLYDKEYISIHKTDTGVLTIEVAPTPEGQWNILYTSTINYNVDMYICVDIYGNDGKGYFIQGKGLLSA